ncbi:response regulator [Spirochaeta cellobiosiphila]|uniref:response regulator n=1 Tax=Spirochaeta cellobiosiphila TaxID=504483 RepID=UPI00040BBD7C|nr:response regulator [Spirochaeta cellobiosiphila]
MAHETILIVEDDADILELIAYNLEAQGYKVLRAGNGENGLRQAKEKEPDLVILDIMLPGIDGLDVCRTIKSTPETGNIPIIMLTAKSEDSDIITGLELGADDYIAKPFSPNILIARIRAVLRRKTEKNTKETVIRVQSIKIDVSRHEVFIDDEPINLSATEFAILKFLAENPGWVFSRNQIIDAVRGGNYPVTERSVDVQILGLRKKLGTQGSCIETVRGIGYRLQGAR